MDPDQAANALIKLSSVRTPADAATTALEGAMAVWDNYKAKIEEVAKAQEAACASMADSTNKVIEAMKSLDEILHPAKTTAEKDEAGLEKKKHDLDEQARQQKEIDAANEKAALAAATNDKQKAEITERYRQKNIRTDEVTAEQKGYLESDAAAKARNQIADIEAEIVQKKDDLDKGNRMARAGGVGGSQEEKMHTEEIITARNNAFLVWKDQMEKQIGNLGAAANKFADAAQQTSSDARSDRTTQFQVHQTEQYAVAETALLNTPTGPNETLKKLLDATNKSASQNEDILQLIITKHLNLASAVDRMHQQLLSRQNQPIGQ